MRNCIKVLAEISLTKLWSQPLFSTLTVSALHLLQRFVLCHRSTLSNISFHIYCCKTSLITSLLFLIHHCLFISSSQHSFKLLDVCQAITCGLRTVKTTNDHCIYDTVLRATENGANWCYFKIDFRLCSHCHYEPQSHLIATTV